MRLTARDFPAGTPLHHFFRWNARRWRPDRRYGLLRDAALAPAALQAPLAAATGNADIATHAAVFAACESPDAVPRRILVIRLSAFGDFVQALGPFAAIRQHHPDAHVTLLTTAPFAAFAGELGCFDEILLDERPGPLSFAAWLRLRRRLRRGRFDRVYDLQTSQRSALYAWLLWPGMPQWSGVAWRCSHPHANLGRDAQHTLDKQAEQLLMAGIHPTPPPLLPPIDGTLPTELAARDFALLAPGASPRHPAKRWPPAQFGALAQAINEAGLLPVVVGTASEAQLGGAVHDACPAALDLVGRTDLVKLAALAQRASLTVGNDNGVCHLASAAGGPVIVLFSRKTDPARHAPRGPLVRVLVEPDLNDLAAEVVITAALNAAQLPPAPRRTG